MKKKDHTFVKVKEPYWSRLRKIKDDTGIPMERTVEKALKIAVQQKKI